MKTKQKERGPHSSNDAPAAAASLSKTSVVLTSTPDVSPPTYAPPPGPIRTSEVGHATPKVSLAVTFTCTINTCTCTVNACTCSMETGSHMHFSKYTACTCTCMYIFVCLMCMYCTCTNFMYKKYILWIFSSLYHLLP